MKKLTLEQMVTIRNTILFVALGIIFFVVGWGIRFLIIKQFV